MGVFFFFFFFFFFFEGGEGGGESEKGDKHFDSYLALEIASSHRKESPDIEVYDIGCTTRTTVRLNECTR